MKTHDRIEGSVCKWYVFNVHNPGLERKPSIKSLFLDPFQIPLDQVRRSNVKTPLCTGKGEIAIPASNFEHRFPSQMIGYKLSDSGCNVSLAHGHQEFVGMGELPGRHLRCFQFEVWVHFLVVHLYD